MNARQKAKQLKKENERLKKLQIIPRVFDKIERTVPIRATLRLNSTDMQLSSSLIPSAGSYIMEQLIKQITYTEEFKNAVKVTHYYDPRRDITVIKANVKVVV